MMETQHDRETGSLNELSLSAHTGESPLKNTKPNHADLPDFKPLLKRALNNSDLVGKQIQFFTNNGLVEGSFARFSDSYNGGSIYFEDGAKQKFIYASSVLEVRIPDTDAVDPHSLAALAELFSEMREGLVLRAEALKRTLLEAYDSQEKVDLKFGRGRKSPIKSGRVIDFDPVESTGAFIGRQFSGDSPLHFAVRTPELGEPWCEILVADKATTSVDVVGSSNGKALPTVGPVLEDLSLPPALSGKATKISLSELSLSEPSEVLLMGIDVGSDCNVVLKDGRELRGSFIYRGGETFALIDTKRAARYDLWISDIRELSYSHNPMADVASGDLADDL